MRFRVIAEPRADFDRWLASEAAPADAPVEPLAVEGQALFDGAGECWACHTVDGSRKARGTKGPNLTHLARAYSYQRGNSREHPGQPPRVADGPQRR